VCRTTVGRRNILGAGERMGGDQDGGRRVCDSRRMPVDGLFSFSSDAGLNLHHLLFAEGWAVEAAESDRRSQAPTAVRDLALRTRPAFDEAVAYYRTQMIERNLFDDTMRDLSLWLTSRGGSAPAGWDEVFSPVLDEYSTSDWPCHHQHNLNCQREPQPTRQGWFREPSIASSRSTDSCCPIRLSLSTSSTSVA
jgi:hypothetical protein